MQDVITTKAYEFHFHEDYFDFKQLVRKKSELRIRYTDIIEFKSYVFNGPLFECKIKDYGVWTIHFNFLRRNEWPLLDLAISQIKSMRTEAKMKDYAAIARNNGENICPSCSARIEPDAKFCSKCGHRIVPIENEVFCPKCGKRLDSTFNFCPDCGYKIN